MKRLLLAVPVLLLAACGEEGDTTSTTVSLDTTAPSTAPTTTSAPSSGFEYASGPDDVVISVFYEGGFVPAGTVFASTPTAMVTGDGRVLSVGPTTMQFPGALLPNLRQQSITPEGIDELLAEADELGLFAEVEYADNPRIADAPFTVVTITVDGTTYEHSAYALDLEPETDPARQALSEFVAVMTDLSSTVGDQLGEDEPYAADTYLVQAQPVDLETQTFEVEPTIEPWPDDAPVALADAAECAELPAAFAEPLLADATQLTFFTEADVTYEVFAVQQYPGKTC